ncbi:hypothetical protein J7E25_01835 [Agromyces sp. ISL-38]|uniref:hypothetical protein n=1 Tax=Agromyces sp. ISL-38 TaxID=2819107 RepID=UPI001BEC32B4|nr:hypothetical protein [Agromyces sp. ISL-38]MBT2497827.1 hypothetical protein [Agromyces sp. ISL-38]MBT2517085.1 hypothetical protein [Streptomyces sp. ISL-90]
MTSMTSDHGRRRGLGFATLAVLAGLLASGCAQNAPDGPGANAPDRPEAQLHEAIDCQSEPSSLLPNAEEPTADPSIPVPGRVPEGFEATAAVRCSVEFGEPGEAGDEMEVFWLVERFEGDLGPLLEALAVADDVPPEGLMCTADMEMVPPLWLEARSGGFVPVHYPRDGCGKTKPAVHDALDGLQVTMVERLPVVE